MTRETSPHPPAPNGAGPSLPRKQGRVFTPRRPDQLPPPLAGEGWGGG
jgi:hypothetical protein